MSDGDVVLTQDDSSGTVHKRVRIGKGYATQEGDNLDQSGAFAVLVDIGHARRPFRLCERCFPNDEPEPTVAPV